MQEQVEQEGDIVA